MRIAFCVLLIYEDCVCMCVCDIGAGCTLTLSTSVSVEPQSRSIRTTSVRPLYAALKRAVRPHCARNRISTWHT